MNSFDILIAAKVSAVSPDCETGIIISFSLIIGFLYLNSDAYSTSTGILANSSKKYSPNKLACHEDPQDININLSEFLNFEKFSSIDENFIPFGLVETLPLRASIIFFGCSKISFSIKCLNPPFSTCSISNFKFSMFFSKILSVFRLLRVIPFLRFKTAISLSFRYKHFFVYFINGDGSEPIKKLFLLIPITIGLPSFAAIISSGFVISNMHIE